MLLILIQYMIIIGRADKADFPELFLRDISIKIDTGAYTSTIHSHDIREEVVDGEKYIEFRVLDPDHPMYTGQLFRTKKYKRKEVRNSFGISELRFVVDTSIILFGNEYPLELSLSERSDMRYPILIGRKLLKKRFVVDPSKKDISYKQKKKSKK
ncbi:MAG: RimK/LysX family protein [Marinilabiliaceae bacterium]|jgi:hypothetical protein|nr:RimK/LysX family protein [Marinilabiliaceae bacterium]